MKKLSRLCFAATAIVSTLSGTTVLVASPGLPFKPAEQVHGVSALPVAPSPTLTGDAATTWLKLQTHSGLNMPNEVPLEDVVAFVRAATADQGDTDVNVVVDEASLRRAERTLSSPVFLSLPKLPLATSFALALAQLDLTYSVQADGIVLVKSAADQPLTLVSVAAANTWKTLAQKTDALFPNETSLADILAFVRNAAPQLSLYADPAGLARAEKTLDSPVHFELRGVSLARVLDETVRQLALTYMVDDATGLVVISAP